MNTKQMKLEVIRITFLVIAYVIYLICKRRIDTKIININNSTPGLAQITIETRFRSLSTDDSIKSMKLVPSTDISKEGLIAWSLIVARETIEKMKFRDAPIFMKVGQKTYCLKRTKES